MGFAFEMLVAVSRPPGRPCAVQVGHQPFWSPVVPLSAGMRKTSITDHGPKGSAMGHAGFRGFFLSLPHLPAPASRQPVCISSAMPGVNYWRVCDLFLYRLLKVQVLRNCARKGWNSGVPSGVTGPGCHTLSSSGQFMAG